MSNTTDTDVIAATTDVNSFTATPADAGEEFYPYTKRTQLFLIMNLATCVIGVIGNALAIFVFISGKELTQKPINRFFIHQSFIDLLACAFTILPCADKTLYLMFWKLLRRAILVTRLISLHTLVIYRV